VHAIAWDESAGEMGGILKLGVFGGKDNVTQQWQLGVP
jgi:hypothetical protein